MFSKRALLSVSDKTNIKEIAALLHQYEYEIISTGGTQKAITEAGIPVRDISDFTGNPEAFSGRMKTISFQVASALLYDRERDQEEAATLGIEAIDIVIVNLYPFEEKVKQKADFSTLIENIDIGGPTMIRAAAKNFKAVTIITDPQDYSLLEKQLHENKGDTTLAFRKAMMQKAFNYTANYDAAIAVAMDKQSGTESVRYAFRNGKTLRYGENSHQSAIFYKDYTSQQSLYDLEILGGKELSYNNMVDINAALEAVAYLENSACSVIKHTNPCGLAQSKQTDTILEMAWNGDTISAFGSVIAFNCPISKAMIQFLDLDNVSKPARKFIEVICAPAYEADAIAYLKNNENLRIIKADPNMVKQQQAIKMLPGSCLVQSADDQLYEDITVVTNKQDLKLNKELVLFGLNAVRQVKSNAIILVREINNSFQLLGMGAGQPNRLVSIGLAIDKARENLSRECSSDDTEIYIQHHLSKAILISDAFFPFPDNVTLAHKHGIRTVVQPGGSMRDKKVIKACEQYDMQLVFTGLRHFKH